ncbi:flagella synthesis protein FlgN [Marinobacter caseinilyticus]|uniref:flagella synthesis protein FlgN n=1 Tax=Marinobacter caseinilyticus TaxID=2692195 RepID=UPI00140B3EF8|nr:flagellar protein FlgN [Marinobacter caseinilyticus]
MAAIDELKQLLIDDAGDLDQLADLLKEEKLMLKGSDIRAVETLTQHKNVILERVRERAKQKIHRLVAMGYRPQNGEPSRFIRSAGMAELTTLWLSAEQRLKTCHQLNTINSRVVSHLQKRLSILSDIFRGSAGQAKLYGAKGQQTNLGQRNILASA